MTEEINNLLNSGKHISAFIECMKSRTEEDVISAKKILKEIKSYSKLSDDYKSYNIKIKSINEEKQFAYSVSRKYKNFLNQIENNVDLTNKTIGYLENTDGYLFNYFSNSGHNSVGYTLDETKWSRAVFSNFPVYKREYMKAPLPKLCIGNEFNHSIDLFIWIVNDYKAEKLFLESILADDTIAIYNFSDSVYDNQLSTHIPSGKTSVPDGLEVLKSKSLIFRVDIDKCRDNNGFMYSSKGHYFVETIKQYISNPNITYRESYLKDYYEKFTPSNRRDNYLWSFDADCFPMDHGWLYDPWRKPANPPLRLARFETRKGGNHNFGPNTEEFGEAEFKRLVSVYESLKLNGYNPDLYVDGYITGYLLVRKNDYRYVISEGQHRIAALAALGYDKIICRFDLKPWTNEIVFYNQAPKWPQVEAGIFSSKLAKLCFEHFFKDNNTKLCAFLNSKN